MCFYSKIYACYNYAKDRKLSYRRETEWRTTSVEILSTAAQLCENITFEKVWMSSFVRVFLTWMRAFLQCRPRWVPIQVTRVSPCQQTTVNAEPRPGGRHLAELAPRTGVLRITSAGCEDWQAHHNHQDHSLSDAVAYATTTYISNIRWSNKQPTLQTRQLLWSAPPSSTTQQSAVSIDSSSSSSSWGWLVLFKKALLCGTQGRMNPFAAMRRDRAVMCLSSQFFDHFFYFFRPVHILTTDQNFSFPVEHCAMSKQTWMWNCK